MYKYGGLQRWFAHHFLEDASGKTGRTKTVSIAADLYRDRMLNTGIPQYRKGFRAFAKEIGASKWNPLSYIRAWEDFGKTVYSEMDARRFAHATGTEHVSKYSKAVQDTADALQKMMDEGLDLGRRSGVLGFEAIEKVPGYLPLKWVGKRMLKMSKGKLAAYGKLLAKGYEDYGLDGDLAERVATAVLRRSKLKELGIDSNPHRLFAKDSRLMLEDILKEDNVSPEDVASIMAKIDRKVEEQGKASFAKRRTPVNLNATMEYNGEQISLLDLVNTDVQTVVTKYATEMGGRAAMANKGIRSDADWRLLRETVLENSAAEHLEATRNIMNAGT